jgi:hypothetical protein
MPTLPPIALLTGVFLKKPPVPIVLKIGVCRTIFAITILQIGVPPVVPKEPVHGKSPPNKIHGSQASSFPRWERNFNFSSKF